MLSLIIFAFPWECKQLTHSVVKWFQLAGACVETGAMAPSETTLGLTATVFG